MSKRLGYLRDVFLFRLCVLAAVAAILSGCGGATAGSGLPPAASASSTSFSVASSSQSSLAATSSSQQQSSLASSSVPMHLRLSGQNIIAPDGQPLMLRGWNWGRWGIAQTTDAADNALQGANAVRIPLRWWGFYSGTDIDSRDDTQTATAGVDANHLAILDDMIAQASAAHLWIILFIDSDCGQNGTQDMDEIAYCDPKGQYPAGHNFWTDPDMRAKFINLWKFIAARYKDTPYLAMFEPLPESNPSSASDASITAFYDEVMAAIRTQAPGIPFILGARSYQMTSASKAYNSQWNDVVYTGNLFVYTNKSHAQNIADLSTRLQHLLDVRIGNNVPVFVQQAGVQSGDDPDLSYLNALLTLLNSSSVGYTYWSYRDTLNPNAYGVIYQDGKGGWITKTNFLNTISGYFK